MPSPTKHPLEHGGSWLLCLPLLRQRNLPDTDPCFGKSALQTTRGRPCATCDKS